MTSIPETKAESRAKRVSRNLRLGLSLAWAASPSSLLRYTMLGMFNATTAPITVWLGAQLVNRISKSCRMWRGFSIVLRMPMRMTVAGLTGA